MPRTDKCVNCGKIAELGGRGLCRDACYTYHHNRHTLDKFPRSTWKNEELMAELQLCLNRGLTIREAAEKIGVKLSALRQAVYRARTRRPVAVGPRSS